MNKQSQDAARGDLGVAPPGRLADPLARRAVPLDPVEILVLDEADRMLDMGFKPAVDRIVGQCPADRQTLFFSATLDGEAGRVAAAYTTGAVRREHSPKPRRPDKAVQHRFIHVERPGRIDALVRALEEDRDLALVFVRTKRGA